MKLINQPYLPSAENGELFIASGIYILSVQIYLSAGRHVHAADNMKQGGLSGAGRTNNRSELTLFDCE